MLQGDGASLATMRGSVITCEDSALCLIMSQAGQFST